VAHQPVALFSLLGLPPIKVFREQAKEVTILTKESERQAIERRRAHLTPLEHKAQCQPESAGCPRPTWWTGRVSYSTEAYSAVSESLTAAFIQILLETCE
jgi:hypothetical protein